ncbi:MAG: hypothetical protein HOC91_18835 [Nitrospinaceae bacterium]|jgi:hypothetical protein|nr:hypothetical protein [Nitrospinaceae bacterium]MBT4432571.1 hypothetical protein [Nitrospinaceae bacterium]MBT5947459.1 hypothetical protein [Nitrospinaceae bacterium]MBT6394084.1 hypothetical protein [Nitrospinaceae bacterium]MBT7857752.1 hypothetical protein [Nitrospinaceae bacterium]
MDSGIWGVWYDLPKEGEDEYLSWLHEEHIPQALKRPDYLWAAHYRSIRNESHNSSPVQKAKRFMDEPELGRGGDYLLLFGANSAHAFLDPAPDDLLKSYDARSREMISRRQGDRTAYFTEVGRVDGPEIAQRGPDLTPAPMIQMGAYRADDENYNIDVALWYVHHRLAALPEMEGCVGARKLLSLGGWARHAILYEFISPEAREHYYQIQEAPGGDANHPTGGIVRTLIHSPDSPTLGVRIWPEVK